MTMTGIERVGSIADVGVEDIALVGNKAATFAAAPRQVNGTRGIRNGAARGQRAGKTLGGGLWAGRTRQAYGQ
jgi:hypothetical protein